jgi:hypothetical protein
MSDSACLTPQSDSAAREKLLYGLCTAFQGRTFGTLGLTALDVNSEDGRKQSRG